MRVESECVAHRKLGALGHAEEGDAVGGHDEVWRHREGRPCVESARERESERARERESERERAGLEEREGRGERERAG